MEQETILQFTRPDLALTLTLSVGAILLVALVLRYRILLKRWRAIGFVSGARQIVWQVVAPLMIVALLGIAFAEPFLVSTETVTERTDVQVCYLFDNAGSMAASKEPESATRMDRARSIARDLSRSGAMLGVETCIGTFNSLASLHLPATGHLPTILSVLDDVIIVGDPAPLESECRAGEVCTDLEALRHTMHFFSKPADEAKRVLVVFTDGETQNLSERALTDALANAGITLVFVDLFSNNERIYDTEGCVDTAAGCVDPNYQSDLLGRETFLGFVEMSESVYVAESAQESADDVLADILGPVPDDDNLRVIAVSTRLEPYAWYFAFLAGVIAVVTYAEHLRALRIPGRRPKLRR